MAQRRGILLQPKLFHASRPAELPVALEDCKSFAIHDLAALAEGNLSFEGQRRLTRHISHCRTCSATLAAIVEDARGRRGFGERDLASWLAAAGGRSNRGDGGVGDGNHGED
jgi:hypothetical protein